MKIPALFLALGLLFCSVLSKAEAADSLQDRCENEVSKVTECFGYASGKDSTPTTKCCTAISQIRSSDPVCLCFLIQQTAKTSSNINSLGIKLQLLLQLPTACKLANASVADCPVLLGLSPTSPDYAIFTNSSTGNSSSGRGSAASPDSGGYMRKARLTDVVVAVVATIFFSVLSSRA